LRGARPLGRRFYTRSTLDLARALLGAMLCRRDGEHIVRGRIVEVEAYTDDDASHARERRRTPRNAVMFGRPGHAYVYFTYGMHFCLNVVAERNGVPGAVLIRGLDGVPAANGPGRLCRALGLDRRHDGLDLTAGEDLWLERGTPRPDEAIAVTRRVGIRAALDLPWRFYLIGSPGVSRRDRLAEAAAAPLAASALRDGRSTLRPPRGGRREKITLHRSV
jgi:DNA-3-methyladenine glycosylase